MKLDFSEQGLLAVIYNGEIGNVCTDLVKDKFEDQLLDTLLYSSKDFTVTIEQKRLWLDNTPMVTRIIKKDNTIEFVDGFFDDGKFSPVKRFVYANISKEFEEEINCTEKKYNSAFQVGKSLIED